MGPVFTKQPIGALKGFAELCEGIRVYVAFRSSGCRV